MRKTLFSKHFVMVSAIILLSITILGVVLLAFSSQYFKQDRYRLLEHNARQAATLTYADFKNNDFQAVSARLVLPVYRILADAIEADIYLSNIQGEILLYAEGTEESPLSQNVAAEIITAACKEGGYREIGRMANLYKSAHYTVGIPLMDDKNAPAAVVFASAPASILNVFLIEILKMFIIGSLAVLILAFAAVYFLTADLVRPLRKMLAATHSFSKGDFSVRVPVESYDEIGQLAIAFNNMASSLATTETVRRSFTANVSHELRTPMTTIGGFIDGILDGTIPDEKRDHYLHIVSDEVKRLSRLVRSMLNISRIEAGELEIKPDLFDVNDTVIRTVFTFEQPLESKKIDVRGMDGGRVMIEADPDLIHQVIYNLIENAVKFTNEGGYIQISYDETESSTSISIKNSGDGITHDEIHHVFDRFYKTDKSRSRDKGGAGLGLHIVRSIINLHNGDIAVHSVEGEYCEFVFTLPKLQSKKKTLAERSLPGARENKK
ncbi:MAG: HAMP domain-containing histidine kinase [Anaerotruncus sp.]|nr:HAMP domain-containing histidine kinase [Anaerotruncus sp.]